ncbi:transposase zinc-binding domain-containing protein [Sorangium sp. So ce216]
METLYGAIDDGAIAVRIPKHAKKELEAYLDCGLLCRGFARLRCERCEESRLVAFSCTGRGFCPSCLGRRMCVTAANPIEDVLPEMKLVAMVTEPRNIVRFLSALGEPTDVPARSPTGDHHTGKAPLCAATRSVTPYSVSRRASRARPTPGRTRVPTARRCAPQRARRRPDHALSTQDRAITTLAVPPFRFAALHFLALRSGFFYLRCAKHSFDQEDAM